MLIRLEKISKLNILIIGNGHYSTGMTQLEADITTDKDFGILLPSAFELKRQGYVEKIFLASRNGKKFPELRKKILILKKEYNWDTDILLFPNDNEINDNSYMQAINQIPRPAIAIIAVPDPLHKKIMLDCMKAKLHVLIVKPVVTKIADLEELIAEQYRSHVLAFVDYHKVYDEANLILKQDIESNKYGDILHIFSKMTQRRDMIKIFGNWLNNEISVNHYLGSHYIHLIHFITKAKPVNVRCTSQYGIVKENYGIDTPDLVETQILWINNKNKTFISYHIAGWADPSETAGMTYQEIYLIGTNGHISSDQRYRGFDSVLSNIGTSVINPYFFYLNKNLDGTPNLDGKYGFKSIKTFILSALQAENGKNIQEFEGYFPTLSESRIVTTILEAADISLREGSRVVSIEKT